MPIKPMVLPFQDMVVLLRFAYLFKVPLSSSRVIYYILNKLAYQVMLKGFLTVCALYAQFSEDQNSVF